MCNTSPGSTRSLPAALYELRCHTKLSCFATERHLSQPANFSTKLENRHFHSWLFNLPPSFLRPGGRHWEGNLLLEGARLGAVTHERDDFENTQAADWVRFVDTELLCGCVLQPSWIIRQRCLSLSLLLLLLSAVVSLLSERDGGDRGLFTLQSPLHFLFHSQAEEAVCVCMGERERNLVCLSGIMACLWGTNGLKEGGERRSRQGRSNGGPKWRKTVYFLCFHSWFFNYFKGKHFVVNSRAGKSIQFIYLSKSSLLCLTIEKPPFQVK